MERKEKKLAINTLVLSLGAICTKGMMFLMTPLFTRWLSQDDYGTFDLILTYVTLLLPLVTLDCSEAMFRFLLDAKGAEIKKILSSSFLCTIVGLGFSMLVVSILSVCFGTSANIFWMFAILLVSQSLYEYMTMVMRGFKKLKVYTVANIIFVAIMAISTFAFVKACSMGIVGIILGYAVGYLVATVFMFFYTRAFKYIRLKYFSPSDMRRMVKYSAPLIPNAVSWWIMNTSDRTIVSIVLGTSSNALLAVANKIPGLCQTVFGMFHISWQQSASENMKDDEYSEYCTAVFNSMLKILLPLCSIIMACDFILFRFIFTTEYAEAYYQVPILVFAIVFSMMAQFFGGIHIARKETKKNGGTAVIAAIINLVMDLALISVLGVYAATISTLVSYIALFMLRYLDIKKNIAIKIYPRVKIAFAILILLMAFIYINNIYLDIACLVLSLVFFSTMNVDFIKKLLIKVGKRFKK